MVDNINHGFIDKEQNKDGLYYNKEPEYNNTETNEYQKYNELKQLLDNKTEQQRKEAINKIKENIETKLNADRITISNDSKLTAKTINNGKLEGMKIDSTDELVNKVFNNNEIYKRLRKQITKGLVKYGEPVKPENYSIFGWHDHLQDELVDAATYNEIMKLKFGQVIESLKVAYKSSDSNNDQQAKMHIKFALSILEGE